MTKKRDKPLAMRVIEAFRRVGPIERAGTNKKRRYKYTKAEDVLAAVREELLKRAVLVHVTEQPASYHDVGPSNGGEQITECRLLVTYTFTDAITEKELKPMQFNGIGRDVEDKSLYKAQTGAQKAMFKKFGLMVEIGEDPEWDGEGNEVPATETLEDVAPSRAPRLVTERQAKDFQAACAESGKTAEQVTDFLRTFDASDISQLKRAKFSKAIVWATDGQGTIHPKTQAVPAQPALPLRAAPAQVEMRIGNQKITFEPKEQKTFSV